MKPASRAAISVREAREAARTIECWLQQNIDVPDEAFKVARFAWIAMQVAAVPDNRHPSIQEQHRKMIRQFAELTAAWPLIE